MIIVLTKDKPPTFYRTDSSITYVLPQATIEHINPKNSDWKILQHMKTVTLKDIKELIEKYMPDVEATIGTVSGIKALLIDWKQISVSYIEDDKKQTLDKKIPIPYRVLTFLVKNPSCIVQGRNSFSNHLGMKYDEAKKVVFVGSNATYIFNVNGLNYIDLDNLKEKVIEHAGVSEEDMTIKNVEDYIIQLHRFDGASDKFRYPTNKFMQIYFLILIM